MLRVATVRVASEVRRMNHDASVRDEWDAWAERVPVHVRWSHIHLGEESNRLGLSSVDELGHHTHCAAGARKKKDICWHLKIICVGRH
jgi:hypothetical protein